MVKRGFVVAVGGAAIVVAGLSGCSSNKACSGSTCGSSGTGTAKVTVDGKDQSITGNIGCTTTGDNVVIAIGNGGTSGMGATLTGGGSTVQTVSVSPNGQPLTYQQGNTALGGDAAVSKDGSKYTITGHLAGTPDMSNPTAGPALHDFNWK